MKLGLSICPYIRIGRFACLHRAITAPKRCRAPTEPQEARSCISDFSVEVSNPPEVAQFVS